MGREGLNLSAKRKEASKQKSKAAPVNTSPADDEDAEGEVEDEDDILSNVPQRGQNKNNMLYIVIGIIVAVALVLVFLLLRGGKGKDKDVDVDISQPPAQSTTAPQQTTPPEQGSTSGVPAGVGTQDFTQNTTMTNSDVLTNPDQYVQDLYGLSTRVDYTVDKISYVADFVSYTKHRGTWGGGLELYWLDAEYKGNQYVVQVPFKYYKELDDTGIVPVKMEVLSIQGSAQDETLTVISYMALDEEVLKDILKNQGKSK